jgi:hypothetical protein
VRLPTLLPTQRCQDCAYRPRNVASIVAHVSVLIVFGECRYRLLQQGLLLRSGEESACCCRDGSAGARLPLGGGYATRADLLGAFLPSELDFDTLITTLEATKDDSGSRVVADQPVVCASARDLSKSRSVRQFAPARGRPEWYYLTGTSSKAITTAEKSAGGNVLPETSRALPWTLNLSGGSISFTKCVPVM